MRGNCIKGLALLALALCLFGQSLTTTIDCGSATDTGFSSATWPAPGGTIAYTIPNPPVTVTDATLRYCVSCSYTIPTTESEPYLVTLTFVESTVQAPGQRVFSVSINDQPALLNLDLFAAAGYLVQIQRSFVAVPVVPPGTSNGQLVIAFSASVRNAVISAITVSPLFVLSAHTSGLLRFDGAGASIVGVKFSKQDIGPGWTPILIP